MFGLLIASLVFVGLAVVSLIAFAAVALYKDDANYIVTGGAFMGFFGVIALVLMVIGFLVGAVNS